jgi:DNA-binding MarR family transcriptional regulator
MSHGEGARPREPFLVVLRCLVEAHEAVMRLDGRHVRGLGLTPSQFDVIATLGATPGMTTGELSQRTLVTKGTLTGVVDRLEGRRLVERVASPTDRRCVIVRLTAEGQDLFRKVFPAQLDFLRPRFNRALKPGEMKTLERLLTKLKESFQEEQS